jgi:hypothetical protein
VEALIPSLHGFTKPSGKGKECANWKLKPVNTASSRERRIEPFVDRPYLVTDNVVRCRATQSSRSGRCSSHLKTISDSSGDKRVTGSGISSKQDGDSATRVCGEFGTAEK